MKDGQRIREGFSMVSDIEKDDLGYSCAECKEPLTQEEIDNALKHRLNMNDVVCDECFYEWVSQRKEETYV